MRLRRLKGWLRYRLFGPCESLWFRFLWAILPKRSEEFKGKNVDYVTVSRFVMPRFIIRKAWGFNHYLPASDRILIFLDRRIPASHRRYIVYHEYYEGELFREYATPREMLRTALEKFQIPFMDPVRLRLDAADLLHGLIALIGEEEKLKGIISKIPPEVIYCIVDLIKPKIALKGNHFLAQLGELELAKEELSPEEFVKYFDKWYGVNYQEAIKPLNSV